MTTYFASYRISAPQIEVYLSLLEELSAVAVSDGGGVKQLLERARKSQIQRVGLNETLVDFRTVLDLRRLISARLLLDGENSPKELNQLEWIMASVDMKCGSQLVWN